VFFVFIVACAASKQTAKNNFYWNNIHVMV